MSIEAVHDYVEFGGLSILGYQGAQMNRQIGFGAGSNDTRVVNAPSRYIERRNQGLGAMADVFKLGFLGPSGFHGQRRHSAL